MKILVTGARGFLGSTLMLDLKEHGYQVIPFEGDVRSSEDVARAVVEHEPTHIVHAAAKIDVGWCEAHQEEAREVNVEGTRNVLVAAEKQGAHIINLSTSSVFSGIEGNYREDDPVAPVNFYSHTKVEGEAIVRTYKRGITVRLLLLGARPDGLPGKNFLEWVINSAKEGKEMRLYKDQFVNQISNWTVATSIRTIIEKQLSEPLFHIGTTDVHSKAEVARMTLAPLHLLENARIQEVSIDAPQDGVIRPKNMWVNVEKAAQLIMPMPTLAEELAVIFSKPPFRSVSV